jgi:hypothetical protein
VTRNACLQVKLLHRLHTAPCLPGLAGHGAPPTAPLQLARGAMWGRTGLPLPPSCPCT